MSDKTRKSIFEMTSEEIEQACIEAVSNREPVPCFEYVTVLDSKERIVKIFKDGHTELVIDGPPQ